jgi:transposase-like protein
MEKHEETRYVKRELKRLLNVFKLQIVQEIERGHLRYRSTKKYGIQNRTTVVQWLRKFGNFDWENKTPFTMSKSTKIMELEAKVKLLEKQKSFLERQAFVADKKAIILI